MCVNLPDFLHCLNISEAESKLVTEGEQSAVCVSRVITEMSLAREHSSAREIFSDFFVVIAYQ